MPLSWVVIAFRAGDLVARLLQLDARNGEIRIVGEDALDDLLQAQRSLSGDADTGLDGDESQVLEDHGRGHVHR